MQAIDARPAARADERLAALRRLGRDPARRARRRRARVDDRPAPDAVRAAPSARRSPSLPLLFSPVRSLERVSGSRISRRRSRLQAARRRSTATPGPAAPAAAPARRSPPPTPPSRRRAGRAPSSSCSRASGSSRSSATAATARPSSSSSRRGSPPAASSSSARRTDARTSSSSSSTPCPASQARPSNRLLLGPASSSSSSSRMRVEAVMVRLRDEREVLRSIDVGVSKNGPAPSGSMVIVPSLAKNVAICCWAASA